MSSFVYFKFRSEKEPTRVSIDGPSIDVWNLKREIITIKRLGDGTDFDLKVFNENTNEEYADDTDFIPKDSTVLAVRRPTATPGKGRAARYVSGKPPASAKPATAAAKAQNTTAMDSAMTEEERVAAMIKMNDAQWQQKQEEMSHDTRIHISGQKSSARKANIPEGQPPQGYICYRCGEPGHWIAACPTNDDPNYDGKPRLKKTTGIPRSMLKKVEKSQIDNLDEMQKQNVMITSEGEYVLAQADHKTWQKIQEQKNANDKAKQNVQTGDRELRELGLECPIDKRMFVDPVKTPCCGKTYCHECIENALLDNDLQCPNCQTENVSLERLVPDEDIKDKVKDYTNKKEGASPAALNANTPTESGSRPTSRDGSKSPKSPGSVAGKKRSASDANENKDGLAVPAPAMKRQKSGDSNAGTPNLDVHTKASSTSAANDSNANSMAEFEAVMQQMQTMPNMNAGVQPMSNSSGGMSFPAAMMPSFMQNMPMMNPMMMSMMMNGGMPNMADFNTMNMNGQNDGFQNNYNAGMNGMNGNFNTNNFNNNTNGNQGQGWNHNQYGQGNGRGSYRNNKKFNSYNKHNSPAPPPPPPPQQQQQPAAGLENVPKGPKALQSQGGLPTGVPTGPSNKFSNQQRHQGKEEDNAYMRQPVNPQRAMNRDKGRRGMRNAEYKEL